TGSVTLAVGRYLAWNAWTRALSRTGVVGRRVLLVGDASSVIEAIHAFRHDRGIFTVVGACIPAALLAPVPPHLHGVPVVGSFRDVLEAAMAVSADTVAVTGSTELTAQRLRRLRWQMEGTGLEFMIMPGITNVVAGRVRSRQINGTHIVQIRSPYFG